MDNSKTIDSITTDDNNSIVSPPIEWTVEHEKILIEWADKAMCFRWLHSKSTELFSSLNAWYTIPVIIISTLTGTANFAQDKVAESKRNIFVMITGGFNIAAAIISTVGQFLKISEMNEGHRVASYSWGKFYRNIRTELAKHPLDRINPTDMLSMAKEEYDRLLELSPMIPKKIINQFNMTFLDNDNIAKPEICDIITPTTVFNMTKDERFDMIKKLKPEPEPEIIDTIVDLPEIGRAHV